jgi:phage portal protein BeeE
MSFLSRIDAAIERAFPIKAVGPKALEQKVPAQAAVAFTDSGRQGKANVKLFRHWSEHSELIRGAIDIRRGQVAVAEWDILANDPEKTYSEPLKSQVKRLFDTPNPTRNSFRNFTEPVVEDILVLDAGCIEKVRNLRGQIAQLWYVDGGEIRVAKYWDGDPDQPRYFWYPDGQVRVSWKNEDFVYIMSRPATNRVVGLSSMEVLKLTIDAELGSSAYNTRQVTSAAPDGMLDLGEGVRGEQVEKFKSYWLAEIAGKGAMAILGGSRGAKFTPFRMSNRDMQFTEWQMYLLRKTALVFGLSPQDLNAVTEVNRASASVFQEQTEDRGLRPLLGNVADYYTREIVWDEAFGGPDNNLRFTFTKLNQRETLDNAKVQSTQTGGMPTRAVNELRKKDGLEPWGPEFNLPMVLAGNNVIRLEDVPSAGEVLSGQQKQEPVGAGASNPKENG